MQLRKIFRAARNKNYSSRKFYSMLHGILFSAAIIFTFFYYNFYSLLLQFIFLIYSQSTPLSTKYLRDEEPGQDWGWKGTRPPSQYQ